MAYCLHSLPSFFRVTYLNIWRLGCPKLWVWQPGTPNLKTETLLFSWPCSTVPARGSGGLTLLQRYISHRQCSTQGDSIYSNVHGSGQQEEGVVNLLFLLLLSLQKQLFRDTGWSVLGELMSSYIYQGTWPLPFLGIRWRSCTSLRTFYCHSSPYWK